MKGLGYTHPSGLALVWRIAKPAVAAAATLLILAAVVGCGRSAPPPPRTRQEIFAERRGLPALFLGVETGRRVIAPGDRGVFVDPESGEVCWRALACRAPNCPGRSPDGTDLLCIEADASFFRKPDGSLGIDPARSQGRPRRLGFCPKCNEIRDPATETAADAERYSQWVQPYVLPETAARLAALDDEMQRRVELERRHRFTPLPGSEAAAR